MKEIIIIITITITIFLKKNVRLKTIGKAYSGLTDKEIDEMTKRLREITIEDKGNRILVKPGNNFRSCF